MPQAKRTSRRRSKAVPMAGLAGVSLALAGGASAANAPAAVTGPATSTPPLPMVTLGEEELSDVSLATFYVFDKENTGESRLNRGQQYAGGCRGGGGRGCGGRGCGGRGCGGRGCGGCRGCGGHGCGCLGGCGCGCAGCGGPCWLWTPAGWVPTC